MGGGAEIYTRFANERRREIWGGGDPAKDANSIWGRTKQQKGGKGKPTSSRVLRAFGMSTKPRKGGSFVQMIGETGVEEKAAAAQSDLGQDKDQQAKAIEVKGLN